MILKLQNKTKKYQKSLRKKIPACLQRQVHQNIKSFIRNPKKLETIEYVSSPQNKKLPTMTTVSSKIFLNLLKKLGHFKVSVKEASIHKPSVHEIKEH